MYISDVFLSVIIIFLSLVCLIQFALILIGGKWLWRLFKRRLFKGKGYVWLAKNYPEDGTISLDFVKIKSPRIKFGKGEVCEEAQITQIYHYERSTGVPFHIVSRGVPTNLNLNKTYVPSESSSLINQTNQRFYNIGLLTGMNMGLKQKTNLVIVALLVIVILFLIISIYFSNSSLEILKELSEKISSVIAAKAT